MKRITIFCGSSSGNDPIYYQHAFELGRTLAERNIGLVYGGAKVGLMGAVADGARSLNGEVIGVLPHFLGTKEIAHGDLSSLIFVNTMHERKMRMHELCDGVIALPGGFGTMEEFFEMLTWGQLGLHQKPVALYNIKGFYDSLMTFMTTMMSQGFLKPVNFNMVLVDTNLHQLLTRMDQYKQPSTGKWITEDRT